MMDQRKTKAQLIEELNELRRQAAGARAAEDGARLIGHREARQEARQRLHDAISAMAASDDIQRVLSALSAGMRRLAIPFQDCGINLVEAQPQPHVVASYCLGREGKWIPTEMAWGQDLILEIWRCVVPAYRRDLLAEDKYGERREYPGYFGHSVRCVLDIPFAFGTLAVNSDEPNAFSPGHVADLEHLSIALEEGIRRRRDLQDLESRNRSLGEEIARREEADRELEKIAWLLTRVEAAEPVDEEETDQSSRDLVKLNTCRELVDAAGEPMLRAILNSYLPLLDTSAAVYEKNGDYAAGIVSSGWCRTLNQASRVLCGTDDDREALASGRWICHESCWVDASKVAADTGQPVDVECRGGIRLYALPIEAGGEVAGSINIGYGDPPQDPDKLQEIASRYGVPVGMLRQQALAYESRPPFITELAMRLLAFWARLIGATVERRRAEEGLQRSEEQYRSLVSRLPIGIVTSQPDGARPSQLNRAAMEILGLEDEDLGRVAPNDLYVDPRDRDELRENLDRDGYYEYEYWLKRRDGTPVLVRGSSIALYNAAGEPVQYEGFLEDITELRQTEQALMQSSRLISLGQMAAGLAHELNQPLTVISTLAEGIQIRREAGLAIAPEQIDTWSRDVMQAVDRMASLTAHLRMFSRDHAEEPREALSLNDVVQGALSMTQAQLKSRGIELAFRLGEGLPEIDGDAYRLEQVVINLLHNARDAVEEREEATGRSDPDAWRMWIEVRTGREGDSVILEVEDSGVGMDEESRLRALEPFYTTKAPDRGTGLGLSISHAIVRDHGGEIHCESSAGQGTVFRVRLPVPKTTS